MIKQNNYYGYPRLMHAGLGNMLIVWADCLIWCRDNNAKMIKPFWTKLRIGPFLRKEKDKRLFFNLFYSHKEISGLNKFYYLLIYKKIPFEKLIITKNNCNKNIVVFTDMNYFERLIGRHVEINEALVSMTKNQLLPIKENKIFVGIHVRFGDYKKPKDNITSQLTSRLSIDWYVAALKEIRKVLETQIQAIIFSDAHDDEILKLLELPNVTRSPYAEAITDLIALSQSTIIIGSYSTFSLWGVFLKQTQVIWFPGRKPASVFNKSNLLEYEAEWNIGDKLSQIFCEELIKNVSKCKIN